MAGKWLLTDDEDEQMQGLTADAQVLYMRGFRRHMDFSSGTVDLTFGVMKRCLEYVPDSGSRLPARRVADISNDAIRARVAELERAGLVKRLPKRSKFEAPRFQCLLAHLGQVRLEREPQRNPKEGTPKAAPTEEPEQTTLYEDTTPKGTPKEPQGRNPKKSGNQVPPSPSNEGSGAHTDAKQAARETWEAYREAYTQRYGVEPLRNAKVNSQIKQFVSRVPHAEAPDVARHYVAAGGFYAQRGHPTDLMLKDAEKLRTSWATGGKGQIGNRQEQLEQSNREVGRRWAQRRFGNAG